MAGAGSTENTKHPFWRKLLRSKLRAFAFAMAAVAAIMVPWHLWQVWQVNNYPQAEATILKVWSEESKRRRITSLQTWGQIMFTVRNGEDVLTCVADVRLGLPEDNLKAGDKIDIVPRADHCEEKPLIPNIVMRNRGIS